jgi:3-deoxy-7-phosphoheptulonate synthase
MDGSRDIGLGLRTARRLLLDLAAAGVPAACEWVNPAAAPYLADLVTWGAVGARTTESQVHRQLASMLEMPVAFKNGTDGDVQVAVEACLAASASHVFPGMDQAGQPAVLTGAGNPGAHVVLRGGRSGPNYAAPDVAKALDMIADAGLPRRVGIDASHANSGKDHRRQPLVAAAVAEQIAAGEHGIVLVMLESFLAEGRQEPGDLATLVYGQSVTDACMGLEATAAVLEALAAAVRRRRANRRGAPR